MAPASGRACWPTSTPSSETETVKADQPLRDNNGARGRKPRLFDPGWPTCWSAVFSRADTLDTLRQLLQVIHVDKDAAEHRLVPGSSESFDSWVRALAGYIRDHPNVNGTHLFLVCACLSEQMNSQMITVSDQDLTTHTDTASDTGTITTPPPQLFPDTHPLLTQTPHFIVYHPPAPPSSIGHFRPAFLKPASPRVFRPDSGRGSSPVQSAFLCDSLWPVPSVVRLGSGL